MSRKHLLLLIVAIFCFSGYPNCATAQPILTFGNLELAPNTFGQTIEVFVRGGDPVQSLDFNLLIGDGGPIANGDNPNFNFITDLDILTGTIFAADNNGNRPASRVAEDGIAIDGTATSVAGNTVVADGLLATLTLDTTGITSGTFQITTDAGMTDLGMTSPTIFGTTTGNLAPVQATGTITIVNAIPEPGSLCLIGFASLAIVGQRRRTLVA